jgi:hypothetical protein
MRLRPSKRSQTSTEAPKQFDLAGDLPSDVDYARVDACDGIHSRKPGFEKGTDWSFMRDNGIGVEPRYKDQVFGLYKCLRYHRRIWVERESA